MLKFIVHTFKASGKWYAEGAIEMTQHDYFTLTRERFLVLAGGTCPGLAGPGDEFDILLLPDGDPTFPKILRARAVSKS